MSTDKSTISTTAGRGAPEARRWLARVRDALLAALDATFAIPAPATEGAKVAEAPSPQPVTDRPPIFTGFPYMYSVLSRGVLSLQLLPEEMTEDDLIELVRVQVTTNHTQGCLLFGPDRAVYFEPDGSARFHPRIPRCWRIELATLKSPFQFDYTPDIEGRRKAAADYVAMMHQRIGSGWGDEDRAGELALAEEIEQLRGVNIDGSPLGLTPCAHCGEHRGRCLDPLRPGEGIVLPVYCRCQNVNRCARCGYRLHARRLNGNYYRPQDRLLIYVPGVVAARHRCPKVVDEDPWVAGLGERFWTVN